MDSLPLEIICIIASHLPRPPRKPGHTGREEEKLVALNEYQRATAGLLGDDLERAVLKILKDRNDYSTKESISRLAPFATISSKWQHAVERLLFEEILLTNDELDDFNSIFSANQTHRRRFLQHLNFRIILPESSDADDTRYESDSRRRAVDQFATEAVRALFNILSTWASAPGPWFELSLGIPVAKDKTQTCRYSYVSIQGAENLPALPFIRELHMSPDDLVPASDAYRQFHPTTMFSLMEKMPSQDEVQWDYKPPGLYLALRRQLRNSFIDSLQKVQLSPAVRKIWFYGSELHEEAYPHDQRLPNLIHPHQQDPLCSTLHRVVDKHNIREFWMEGQVEPSLFWPYPETEAPPPFWQAMETLHIGCSLEAPNGRWYFKPTPGYLVNHASPSEEPLPVDNIEHMPPGYGTTDDTVRAFLYRRSLRTDRKFRGVPNDAMVAPLLVSFARAMSQMPLLKFAVLWNNPMEETWSFTLEYRAPGYQPEYEKYSGAKFPDLSKPRVIFEASSRAGAHRWRPNEDVVEIFRNVSMESHGKKAEIISWWDRKEHEEEIEDAGLADEEEYFSDEFEDDFMDGFGFEFLTDEADDSSSDEEEDSDSEEEER
ncbi:hypothetical protein QBC36DRAFT_100008 [Triangularia setosa]|uniref:F-box domain-containing protein n=1 Tax=Triangularia setosa TaxID=2587417 RepID=A0AAN6VXR1_9PEZI|nr:hypothetical protein QBC36DRAFT_100008 [Podospora setosa]